MLANMLTFDIEDWYHSLQPDPAMWHLYENRIEHGVRVILDILKAANTRATFFVLGHVIERQPSIVEQIARDGHEIASHGSQHRFAYRQTPEEFEHDVKSSIDELETITNRPVLGYRAPYFSITKESLWALEVLVRLGLRYDSSVFPTFNHRYGIPSATRLPHKISDRLVEVPLSTYPVGRLNLPCCGGVYFRLLPYYMTRSFLRHIASRGEPIVFYLHPWECDPGHPRIEVPLTLKTRHYWALGQTADRLSWLVREFRFRPIAEALGL